MKRYRLVEYSTTNYGYLSDKRLAEASFSAKQFISQVKSMKFKIDWDKIENEMGVEIPEELRDKYIEAYGSEKLTGSSLIKILSIIGIPFAALALFFAYKVMINKHSSGDWIVFDIKMAIPLLLVLVYYIILCIADSVSTNKKLSVLNKAVIKKIILQMRRGGIKNEDIKKAWGVAYDRAMGTGTYFIHGAVITSLLMMGALIVAAAAITLKMGTFSYIPLFK